MADLIQDSFSRRVLSDMNTAVLVLDRKGRILYLNRPASRMLELAPDPAPGARHFRVFTENAYNDDFNEYILDALYQKTQTHIGRAKYQAPSGRKYVFRMSSSYLEEPDTESGSIVITISDVTREAALQDKVHDSAMTFTAFLFCFSVWIILYALWDYLGRPLSGDDMTHGIELIAFLMLIFILRHTKLTWRDLGIYAPHPGKTVRTALIVGTVSFVFLCALKAAVRLFVPAAFGPDAPFLDLSRFGTRQLSYLFTAGIQEFLARSVMQGNLRRVMVRWHPGAASVILSSLIFASMHIHMGFLFMMGAAMLAGLSGILYEKQQTILGVWIVHWIFGVSATLLYLIDH